MSREEAIELLRNCDKLIRYHPNVRKAIELLESEPAGDFTKDMRTRYADYASGKRVDYAGLILNSLWEACDRIDRLEEELKAKDEALKESITLQAYYAALLNQYDGGERIVFKSVEEWLDRFDGLRRTTPKKELYWF